MMSSFKRRSLAEALPIAERLRALFEPYSDKISYGGSVRRQSATVGDIELVIVPKRDDFESFHWQVNQIMKDTPNMKKAVYGSKETTKFGPKAKGILLVEEQIVVELRIGFSYSWGYNLWLGTGPGQENKDLMVKVQQRQPCPFYFEEGVVHDRDTRRHLLVPTEEIFFELLGIDYIAPEKRLEGYMNRALHPSQWKQWGETKHLLSEAPKAPPKQQGLF